MIDAKGYRPNVGIVIMNNSGQLFWARRYGQDGWQFPQGGIDDGEAADAAMYRELYEEVGLRSQQVALIAATSGWLRYKLPENLRRSGPPGYIGQKQKWYLLRLVADDSAIRLDCGAKAEFDRWQWVSYWYPLAQVVPFKRDVYRKALLQLAAHYTSATGLEG